MHKSLTGFVGPLKKDLSGGSIILPVIQLDTEWGGENLNTFSVWSELTQVVGEENVSVLPFELLEEDDREFLDRWLGFLGVSEKEQIIDVVTRESNAQNVRSETKDTWQLREVVRTGPNLRPTRFFQALGLPTQLPLRWPDFSRGSQISLTPQLKERIMSTYRGGNKEMEVRLNGMKLSEYGYY